MGLVTAAKLATDAVETAKVKDVNVTAGKLAATQDLSTKTITLTSNRCWIRNRFNERTITK